MTAVVDYGVGNLASVCNMLRKAGGIPVVSRDPQQIVDADRLLLPGVGHFDYGMKRLNESGLRPALEHFALELKRPVLGICLGAQILGNGSEEGESHGLGWIDMWCRRFKSTAGLRVPHMGWRRIEPKRPSPLLAATSPEARFYFVHSFRMECANEEDVLGTANYGGEFTCVVQRENVSGVQFHPEKSLKHGLALLQAFVQSKRDE
jgi:glutamine amidotransferase